MNSTRKNPAKKSGRATTRKQGQLNLFYMARPPYGGWVSFTAHLALKHELPLFKIGNKTEESKDGAPKLREFGYGVQYQNLSVKDIPSGKKNLITAIDKTCYCHLKEFPTGTYIVIHDPTEVSSKATEPLVAELKRFKILTIRKSVQDYLKEKLNLSSKFLVHPFFEYPYEKSADPKDAVSISRIDFDKHTDILLKANKELRNPIKIYGAHNRLYVHFKLEGLGFKKYYKGQFEKSFEELSNILKDAKYVTDMSVIKHDGGGSQYTFLEAIYQKCALIINEKWVEGFATPFKNKVNCFVVKDSDELVQLLTSDPSVTKINTEAKKMLEPHIKVNWVKAIQSY
jgi:hypothetical protein